MNNHSFDDQCMQFIKEQADIDKSYAAFRRKSFRFYIIAIFTCLALVSLSLISYSDNIMPSILLQAFAVGVISFIIMTIRVKPGVSL
jgi:uncharacterized membrane protein YcjF (UPF0283 family)